VIRCAPPICSAPGTFSTRTSPTRTGRVFQRVATLGDVPDGYRAMNEREAIKILIEF
jgi:hypothetical protein